MQVSVPTFGPGNCSIHMTFVRKTDSDYRSRVDTPRAAEGKGGGRPMGYINYPHFIEALFPIEII